MQEFADLLIGAADGLSGADGFGRDGQRVGLSNDVLLEKLGQGGMGVV